MSDGTAGNSSESARDDAKRTSLLPRSLTWLALGILALVAVVYTRAIVEANEALAEARSLESQADPESPREMAPVIRAFRHCVEWYAPINPSRDDAVDRLFAMATSNTNTDDRAAIALAAAESLRSGLLVTRTLWTPNADLLPALEEQIATLRGQEISARQGIDDAEEIARQRGLLASSRERAPAPGWSLLVVVSFIGFLAVAFVGLRGRARHRLVFAVIAVALVGLWVVGLLYV